MGLERTNVVVVGGAVGGMTAALLLARAGASVTLLERVAEPGRAGAGILLQANGLAVLYGLGLRERLLRAAYRRDDGGAIRSGTGTPLIGVRVPRYAYGLDHVLVLRRSHLYQVLYDTVVTERGIDARFGATVTGATPAGTLTYSWQGRSGALAADLVIGADGVSSTVREAGNLGAVVSRTGATYLRALVDGQDLFAPGEYWTGLGLFGGMPVGDGSTYFFADASAPPVAAALASRDLAALTAHWAAELPLAAPAFERIRRFGDLLINEVRRVDCERWTDGRLTLLGDAAHAMAPNLGQGANSALVDAAVLTAELFTARPLETALRRYADRRRSAVRWVQDASDRLARLSSVSNPALRRARDLALWTVQRQVASPRRHAQNLQEHPAELYETVTAFSGTRRRAR
jgi:2-polyprenyl-6-methoxyphenol hydroxylase-like FAD-dependent oxidoreductase